MVGFSLAEQSELRGLVRGLSDGDRRETRRLVELLARTRRLDGHRATASRRLRLVLVSPSGRRVVTPGAQRWLIKAGALGVILIMVAGGAVYRDYRLLSQQRMVVATLREQLASNEAFLDHAGPRVREISDEIDSWHRPHASIQDPARLEDGHPAAETGPRGTAEARRAPASQPPSVTEEMARLVTVVEEESNRLRSLHHFVDEHRDVLTSLPSRWPVRGPVNSEFGPRRSPFNSNRWAPRPSAAPRDMDPSPAR